MPDCNGENRAYKRRSYVMEPYSVLMTVYQREEPAYFEQAIQSILGQTVKTDDFVIVCDGPLSEELDAIISHFTLVYPEVFNVLRLPQNQGIGAAANAGLRICKHDLIAKMDADDLAVPDRCETQLRRFEQEPNLMVLGGDIEEFDMTPDRPYAVREVPRTNEEIRSFAQRRQPFNNVTVMMRKSAIFAVGGYRSLRRNEDYDLFIRLLNEGFYAENLGEVLVKVRVDRNACKRRSCFATFQGTVRSRWNAYRIGYSSLSDFLYCSVGAFFLLICPGRLQELIYSPLLRKK